MPVNKLCVICGEGFSVKANRGETAKTCSSKCRGKLQAERYKVGRVAKKCRRCKKRFLVTPYLADVREFCSPECKYSANRVDLTCGVCGTSFWIYKSQIKKRGKFCSKACADVAKRGGLERVEKNCGTCGATFHVNPSRSGISKFCSKECVDISKRTRVDKICETCGETFSINAFRADTARFCSSKCKWVGVTDNPEWQSPDGVSYWGYKRSGTNGLAHRDIMLAWMLEKDPNHPFLITVKGQRKLDPQIEVHHIDRNRINNARSNLLAVTKHAHSRIHHLNRKPKPWECWPTNPRKY